MIESSCKEKILGRLNVMTNTERKIADYALENYEEVLNSNITELAEKAKVSDASIVRFCRSLGYKGYQDFKINAAKDVLPREKHFNPVLEKDDNPEVICRKIFESEVSVLNRTLAGLDINAVTKAAKMIEKAKRVMIFGSGGSLLVAQDALHKLMKVGVQVYVYEDRDLQLMASSLAQTGDLVIGISHSGSNYSVLRCLKNAHENQTPTIAIVNRERTPISKIADVVIHTASEETMFQSESVSTRIAQLAIIDSLVAMVAFGNYEESYNAIQKTRRATSENKF